MEGKTQIENRTSTMQGLQKTGTNAVSSTNKRKAQFNPTQGPLYKSFIRNIGTIFTRPNKWILLFGI